VLTYLAADDRGTQARLLVGGKSYPVRAAGLGIGRSGENEVRLDDQLSSRRHARIECWVGEWVVVDLDSTNGTYLNGRPINRERLRDGDRIRIGDTHLEFRSGVGSDRQGR
jgi:pSer/pThr/pTyr-binding forkhead associated (FHA) protein